MSSVLHYHMRMNWFPRLALLSLLFTLLPYHLQSISTSTDYIHRSCNSTCHPKLCFKTLSRYARVVQTDPARLARVAISVSHSHVRGVAAYLYRISLEVAATPIHDCAYSLNDAAEEIGESLGQIRKMDDPGAPVFPYNVGDVQTWMSAAIVYHINCEDELEDFTDAEMKKTLLHRVHRSKNITCNALAFVNMYFDSLSTPSPSP